ncbi:MAG: hypothetical protein V1793_05455 [Pseudomonadota bacterium]
MPDPVMTWAPVPAILELVVLLAALFGMFRHFQRTLAESAASSIMLTLMAVSLLQQIALIHPAAALATIVFESGIAAVAGWICWQRRTMEIVLIREVCDFWVQRNKVVMASLVVCWGYLAFKGVNFTPAGPVLAGLKSLKAASGLPGFCPSNTLVLSRHFVRFGTFRGIGLFGFLGYLSIAFSTYALSRRYAWLPVAFTVAVAVACFPRFVLLAAGPGVEIIPAAASVFAILETYRLKEKPCLSDLYLLVLAILFVSSHDAAAFLFSCVLAALCLALLVRRHGSSMVMMARSAWKRTLLLLFPMAFFSRIWAWRTSSLFDGLDRNPDELMGGAANACRYLLDSIDVTQPVDHFFKVIWHVSAYDLVMALYKFAVYPVFGNRGSSLVFQVADKHGEVLSWFGPFASFLVLGAVVLALVRGPRRLKFVGIALTAYVYLLSLVFEWRPENVRFFSSVYACAGFFLSFLLPPWRLDRYGKWGLQIASIIGLIYTCFFLPKPI